MDFTREIELLEREILFLYKTLAGYGYFMGDISPLMTPWFALEDCYKALLSEETEPWVSEGALLLAVTILWGQRDGAHSIDAKELARIDAMVQEIRVRSERTEEIAKVVDLIKYEGDESLVSHHSRMLYRKYVVGYLKALASLAEESDEAS